MPIPIEAETLKQFLEEGIPFNRFLGMRVSELGTGWGRLELPYRPEFIGDPLRPALHGGLISTLLDTAGGMAVFSRVDQEMRVSTIDMRVDFLRPGAADLVIAEAKVIRVGNRVAVVDAFAYHPGGKSDPIATAKGVYSLRKITLRPGAT